jgi:uridine phosphorylase
MTNTIKSIAAVIALFMGLGFAWFFATYQTAGAGSTDAQCVTRAVTAATIGHQASSQVLATTSVSQEGASRAYARIQLPVLASGSATNTASLSFKQGSAAAANVGIVLSTTTPYIEFGLNTAFPYNGAVTALSSTGSTTLLVTECVYPTY